MNKLKIASIANEAVRTSRRRGGPILSEYSDLDALIRWTRSTKKKPGS